LTPARALQNATFRNIPSVKCSKALACKVRRCA
jgi:hypothetical protein